MSKVQLQTEDTKDGEFMLDLLIDTDPNDESKGYSERWFFASELERDSKYLELAREHGISVRQWKNTDNLNTYKVTMIVKELGIRETYQVMAEDEWKARTVAQMMNNNTLNGAFVDYEVEEVK